MKNASLQSLFDEHASPQHGGRRELVTQLAPITRVAAQLQKQLVEYRTLISAAALDEAHDPTTSDQLEMAHQTFDNLETHVREFSRHAREITKGLEQLDRYMSDWQARVESNETSAPAPASGPTT